MNGIVLRPCLVSGSSLYVTGSLWLLSVLEYNHVADQAHAVNLSKLIRKKKHTCVKKHGVFYYFEGVSNLGSVLLYPGTKVGDILDSAPSRREISLCTRQLKNRSTFVFKLGTHIKGGQRKIPILR